MLIGFHELFHEKKRTKNTVPLAIEKKQKTCVFPFREAWSCLSQKQNRASRKKMHMLPLAETKQCLSQKRKQKTLFFLRETLSQRHIVPLAKIIIRKDVFLFPRGTAVPHVKAKQCLSWKQNLASHEEKAESPFFSKKNIIKKLRKTGENPKHQFFWKKTNLKRRKHVRKNKVQRKC